jgi:hypothetical protein
MTATSLSADRAANPAAPGASTPTFSVFERWPGWLFYAPIAAQWIARGILAGDLSLLTAANPSIETGGLCGESKAAILDSIQGASRHDVARYATLVTGDADMREATPIAAALGWPLVVKPDIGCNGTGVRLVQGAARLEQVLAEFPRGVRLMLQAFVPDPHEAGIFYIRHPDEAQGRITSLTLKAPPVVVGDGRSTLRALLRAHPRASRTPQLFLSRLQDRLDEVPNAGVAVPLVFTGNHCKGSVFRDGAALVTPALTRRIEAFARDIPDFHFGRIDLRFASEDALRSGEGFTIIEVNGVGSEATHIWDAGFSLTKAYADQFAHYGAAWDIATAQRARGHRSSGLRSMYRAWRLQRRLMASYPPND